MAIDFLQQEHKLKVSRFPWLKSQHEQALQVWMTQGFPRRSNEHWKYARLKYFESTSVVKPIVKKTLPSDVAHLSGFDETHDVPANSCEHVLTFIDGTFSAANSKINQLPKGVHICRFSEANSTEIELIQKHLLPDIDAQHADLSVLNTLMIQDGIFLYFESGVAIDEPILLRWIGQVSGEASSQRTLVLLAKNSKAQIVEQFFTLPSAINLSSISGGDADGKLNEAHACTFGVSEYILEDHAQLNQVRIHAEHESVVHVGSVNYRLNQHAQCQAFHFARGSAIKRINIKADLLGQGAHVAIDGVYLPTHSEHVDYHLNIQHHAPHCRSDSRFRGIVAHQAKAVFNGRIHIVPQAQKSSAQLSNKNLLASDRAEVFTKPELEIYADDVRCSHGATIARLNDEAIHYLRSRGIDLLTAKKILSFSFINELVLAQPVKQLAVYLDVLTTNTLLFAAEDMLIAQGTGSTANQKIDMNEAIL